MKEDLAHILIVDDDDRIRSLLLRYLTKNDMVAVTAEDAAEARKLLKLLRFHLVVLDVMMPGESGLNLARFIKESYDLPVLLLTARGEIDDRIKGFEAGADDYLPKPFEPKELILRIEAILRRSKAAAPVISQESVSFGGWVFDAGSKSLKASEDNDAPIVPLTDTEVALLDALSRRPNVPIKREILAQQIGMASNDRAIDVQVTRLRKKIEKDPKMPQYLQTVRGQGYMLKVNI